MPIRLPAEHDVEKGRTSLIRILDSHNPRGVEEDVEPEVDDPEVEVEAGAIEQLAGVEVVLVPVPVVPVPVVELEVVPVFCNRPKSISDPLFRTIPCKLVGVATVGGLVVVVANTSVNFTVIVQSEFKT
jgi:hypothetical protein